jgi:hypothetical protein
VWRCIDQLGARAAIIASNGPIGWPERVFWDTPQDVSHTLATEGFKDHVIGLEWMSQATDLDSVVWRVTRTLLHPMRIWGVDGVRWTDVEKSEA